MKTKFNHYIKNLQDSITQKLADLDGEAHFKEDLWERSGGGGGCTRIIENGGIFEKGGGGPGYFNTTDQGKKVAGKKGRHLSIPFFLENQLL